MLWRETDEKEEKKHCLSELLSRCATSVPPEMLARLVTAIDGFTPRTTSSHQTSQYEQQLRARLQSLVAAQPRNSSDYESSGLFHTGRLVAFLDKNLDVLQRPAPELLRQAAQGHNPFPDSDGSWLAMLESLLNDGRPSTLSSDQQDSEVENLFADLMNHLRARARDGSDGIVDAVEAFAEELEDPKERQTMIERYARVVAATCQQSVSKAYEEGDPQFEFVIVDEAARANPLDLLIPLSRGKRIVLVGDHKQLPQMLEPDVIESYRALHPDLDERLLQQSLFERLFDLLRRQSSEVLPPERLCSPTISGCTLPSVDWLVVSLQWGSQSTTHRSGACSRIVLLWPRPLLLGRCSDPTWR